MRNLTRDPNAAANARAAEKRANEEAGLKSIDLPSAATSGSASGQGVKKKPVFKSTLQPHNAPAPETEGKAADAPGVDFEDDDDPSGAIRNGWADDAYDPEFVMGCEDEGCSVCVNGQIYVGGGGGTVNA
jgi:hypothetical protein